MKTLFVTIDEFLANGGVIEYGRNIYKEEAKCFDSNDYSTNKFLDNTLLLGYFMEENEEQGTWILKNNSFKSFPVTGLVGYVKIEATPIYK